MDWLVEKLRHNERTTMDKLLSKKKKKQDETRQVGSSRRKTSVIPMKKVTRQRDTVLFFKREREETLSYTWRQRSRETKSVERV